MQHPLALSRGPQPATARLRDSARGGPRTRCVVARGILDSWRRSQGVSEPPEADQATAPVTRSAAAPPGPPETSGRSVLRQLLSLDVEDSVHFTDEDTPCPVECVLELGGSQDLRALLESAPRDALVVVDFYKTACGACKYIAPGFVKLCKATQAETPSVLFAKHNVYDDEDETATSLAKEMVVRNVPMFVFFKGGVEVERFPTRDKKRVAEAISKHSPLTPEDLDMGE